MLKKTTIALSLAWIAYVTFLYWSAYSSAKPFQEYLTGECPQITIHVLPPALNYATVSRREYVELIAWFDQKTGKEIFITSPEYRRYQAVGGCTKRRFMAFIAGESAKAGVTQPKLRIKYDYMLIIMIVPPALIFLATGLLVMLFRFLGRRA